MFVSAATVWPLEAARAQQSENLARIGFLPLGSPSNQHDLSWVEVFRKGLIENGLIEGRNIILDVVWVANDSEYDQAAIELVRRGATVLVPVGSSASAACKRQTSTIPIVFLGVGNPVGIGIVESLSHPGGNVTGFADLTVDLSGKLLEFAKELTPAGKPIGYLWYDKWMDGQSRLLAIEQAAKASGMALQARAISDVVELNSAVADLKSNGIKAVIVQPSGFTWQHRQQIIEVMNRSTLAMICAWPPIAAEGALIGYGTDYPDVFRRAGSYVSRVLKGEKPAELPVQNPTKFRLVINLNAAKVLGLQIPTNLLATADEVIE